MKQEQNASLHAGWRVADPFSEAEAAFYEAEADEENIGPRSFSAGLSAIAVGSTERAELAAVWQPELAAIAGVEAKKAAKSQSC